MSFDKARLVGELKGLAGPEGVAVAPDGRVIVTNTRGGTLSVFHDGKLERSIGSPGAGDGEFASPHDVEAASDGSIHVVDSANNRVQVFDAALKHRASFGPALGLSGPKYLAFDGEWIWLADEYNHRILLLDRRYQLLGVLGTGKRGRGANAFYKPEAVLARAPYVWVIDTYNDRIVLLKVEYAFGAASRGSLPGSGRRRRFRRSIALGINQVAGIAAACTVVVGAYTSAGKSFAGLSDFLHALSPTVFIQSI